MHDTIDISGITTAVLFTGLGVMAPSLFHALGLGAIFLPMYLPLAIGAFLLGRADAALMGACTPLVSALLTGMPPFYPPIAVTMAVQLGAMCLAISLVSHRFEALSRGAIVLTLVAAFAVERSLMALLYRFVMPLFGVSGKVFTAYDLVKSLPGIAIIFAAAPFAVPKAAQLLRRFSIRPYERSGD